MKSFRWLIVAALAIGIWSPTQSLSVHASQIINFKQFETASPILKAYWQSRDSNYNRSVGSAPTYQGPGDIVSGAKFFYSCRAYNAAYEGGKAYRLINETTTLQMDISTLSNGQCDTTTPATFCLGAVCKWVTWYDQSGALACGSAPCDVTNGTDADRPLYQASTLNGWACPTYNSVTAINLENATGFTLAQPFSIIGLSERTQNFTIGQQIFYGAGNTSQLFYRSAANAVGIFNGGTTLAATAADSAFHVIQGISNGASSSVVVDGSATTGSPGSSGIAGSLFVFNTSSVSGPMQGPICELGLWPSAFNSTQYGNINTNLHSASYGWNF